MKERPLTDAERAAIDKHGLYNLSQFLPKKPDEDGVRAIIELFHASVNEELYDTDRWGQYFRPNGMRMDNASGNTESSSTYRPAAAQNTPAPSSVTAASIMSKINKPAPAAENDAPWDNGQASTAPAAADNADSKPKMQTPEDILAAIRRRQGK